MLGTKRCYVRRPGVGGCTTAVCGPCCNPSGQQLRATKPQKSCGSATTFCHQMMLCFGWRQTGCFSVTAPVVTKGVLLCACPPFCSEHFAKNGIGRPNAASLPQKLQSMALCSACSRWLPQTVCPVKAAWSKSFRLFTCHSEAADVGCSSAYTPKV